MVVIRSFPFGCITGHVDAVISTSSYRKQESSGVVCRRTDSFGPSDGVGARSSEGRGGIHSPAIRRDHGDRSRDGEYRDGLRQLRNSGRPRRSMRSPPQRRKRKAKHHPPPGVRDPPQSALVSLHNRSTYR